MWSLDNWTKNDYIHFVCYLKELGSKEYIQFTKKITPGDFKMIGIRIPVLRSLAKEISKGNYNGFLKVNKNDYFEEFFLEGFVIGNIRDENYFDQYVSKFISKIDNWAVCDSCVSSFKIIKKNPDKYFSLVETFSKSDKEFEVRASLIMLLSLYKDNSYLDQIFSIIKSIDLDYYYVKMAKAWLLCELFITNRKKTLEFIMNNQLDDFTIRKFVSKCQDSYRVSIEDKKMLKGMSK